MITPIKNELGAGKVMNQPDWKVSRYTLFLSANILAYLLLSMFVFQKSMFSAGDADGFYSQIFYVANEGSWSTSPLYFVHLLRFFAVSPFYYLYVNGFHPFFESVLILVFLMPVLTARFGARQFFGQAFFVYLPLLFSYRSVLVMCSISYLFICLYGGKRSYLMLVASMFLANLSSGVVLPWLLITLMNIKSLSRRYKYIRIAALCVVVVLGFSVLQKIGFFLNEYSSGNSILERSTFYVSILNGQYARFAVYSALLMAWFVISLAKIRYQSFSMHLYTFYIPVFITFFFEGLGLISFLIPILWFFVGVRPSTQLHGVRGPLVKLGVST